jgi:hypothetical protein
VDFTAVVTLRAESRAVIFRFASMAEGLPVLRERSRAARPATCGDAIDVPENETMPPPAWTGAIAASGRE